MPPPLHSWLSPCVCFLEDFPGCFSLSCSSGFPVHQSPSCFDLKLFSRPLVLSPAVVPGSLIPLRCLTFRHLVTVPVWSQGFLYLSRLSPPYPSVVLRCLPSVRRPSLGYGPPVLFLFSVSSVRFWVRCSPHLPPFRRLVSSRLALLFCGRVLWASLLCW